MASTSGRVESPVANHTYFYVKWQQVTQYPATNHTNINWQAGIRIESNAYWLSNAVKIHSVWVYGNNVGSGTFSNISGNGDHDLLSGAMDIGHDANGYRTFNTTIYGWFYGNGDRTAAGDFALNRLAVAPSIGGTSADTITANSARLGTKLSSVGRGTNATGKMHYRALPSGAWSQTSEQGHAATWNYWTITGLAAYTTYEYKAYWINNNGDVAWSSVKTFQTLGYPNYTNGSPYCETIKSNKLNVAVCVDSTCDLLQLRVNGGGWTTYSSADFSSWKVVTVTGLASGTKHSFQTRIRRKDSQLTRDSGVFYGTTKSHSAITACTGDINDTATSVSIWFSNPAGTPVDVYIEFPDLGGVSYKRTYNVTSPAKLTLDSTTMDSIRSKMNTVKSTILKYVVHDAMDGDDVYTVLNYRLTIVDADPIFSDFTYLDTNTSVVNHTGDNQYLLQDYSSLRAVISSGNKAVATKGATISKYLFNINGVNGSKNYSTSTINYDIGSVNSPTNQALTITAVDSRGNTKSVVKTVLMVPYSRPTVSASVTRLNGFENDTTVKIDGTFSQVIINGVAKNTIGVGDVKYRYKQDGGSFTNWISTERSLTAGRFTTENEYLMLDNLSSFTFEINVKDLFDNKTIFDSASRGKPLMMISSNMGSIGVGKIPEDDDTIDVDEDMLIHSKILARDHHNGNKPRVVNICYGTSPTPPNGYEMPGGTIYIQYTD